MSAKGSPEPPKRVEPLLVLLLKVVMLLLGVIDGPELKVEYSQEFLAVWEE